MRTRLAGIGHDARRGRSITYELSFKAYDLMLRALVKHLTPSALRQNLYRVLDEVLETGEPVIIDRKGRRLKITLEAPRRLEMLEPHADYIVGDPDDLVHIDWSDQWRP
jgi:hypothetical protein